MKEELISFETAKLAKEKGFELNYPISCYTENRQLWISENLLSERITGKIKPNNIYKAPTQSLLQKWLREVHDIHVEVSVAMEYYVSVYNSILANKAALKFETSFGNGDKLTYEEALELGLQEALKLI